MLLERPNKSVIAPSLNELRNFKAGEMRYQAQVIPLFEGRRQVAKATWEYTDAASVAQAGRFLRIRFPYPKYVVEEPVADPRSLGEAVPFEKRLEGALRMGMEQPEKLGMKVEKKDNPGNLRKMRIKLIELKTDMENAAPELEGIYRTSMEEAVNQAHYCNLYGAMESYSHGEHIGQLIHHRLGTGYGEFTDVENLARQAIIEELVKNCGCQIFPQEPKKES